MMLTRCPACQTVFRLRPEQVQARRGEVRCGHCFNPFNALAHRIGDSAETPSDVAAEVKVEGTAPETPPPTPLSAPAETSFNDLDFEVPESLLPERQEPVWTQAAPRHEEEPSFAPWQPAMPAPDAPPGHTRTNQPEALRLEPVDLPAEPQEEPPAFRGPVPNQAPPFPPLQDFIEPTFGEAAPALPAESSAALPPAAPEVIRSERRPYPGRRNAPRAEPGEAAPAETPEDRTPAAGADDEPLLEQAEAEHGAPADSGPDLDRLDKAYGPAPGSQRVQRTVLSFLSSALAIGLAAQAIYIFRLDIARELPGLRPLLVAACQHLECAMPLPQAADKLNINAELQSEPGRPGRYILYATVKNHAAYTQAWPHLELTLTDAADNPMVRRVLAPEEWAPPERLPSGLPGRGDISLRLPFDAPGLVPTGYRVYLFYP